MLGFQGMFLLGKNGSWFLPLNIFGTFSPWKVELDKFVMNSCPESCGTSFLTFLIGSSSGRDDVKQVFLVFFFGFWLLPNDSEFVFSNMHGFGPEGLEDGNTPGLEKGNSSTTKRLASMVWVPSSHKVS